MRGVLQVLERCRTADLAQAQAALSEQTALLVHFWQFNNIVRTCVIRTNPYCIHSSASHPPGMRLTTVIPAPIETASRGGSRVVKAATWRSVGKTRRGMLNINKKIRTKDSIHSSNQENPSRIRISIRVSRFDCLVVGSIKWKWVVYFRLGRVSPDHFRDFKPQRVIRSRKRQR